MKRIALRALALTFAVTVLVTLVVHASVTSGCSKPGASVTAAPAPPASSMAPGSVAMPDPTSSASAEPPKGNGRAPLPASHSDSPFGSGAPLGGSKSGIIVRPRDVVQQGESP
jgi:hypothetical protein